MSLHRALGRHASRRHTIAFARDAQWIGHRTHQLDLLHSPDVTRQLLRCLAPPPMAQTQDDLLWFRTVEGSC